MSILDLIELTFVMVEIKRNEFHKISVKPDRYTSSAT